MMVLTLIGKVLGLYRDRLPVLEGEGRAAAAAGLGQDQSFLPQAGEACWKIEL